jgi:uncharacterized membrane protein
MEVVGGIPIFIAAIVVLVILVSVFSWATNTNIQTRSGGTITPDTFPTLAKASAKGIKNLSQSSIDKINKLRTSSVNEKTSKLDNLEKLNKLYASGSLTLEEYESLKNEIINLKKH